MMRGILLALQFFTIVPVNKQLEMNRTTVTAMFSTLPWIGSFIGVFTTSMWLFVDASPLFIAFLIVLTGIVLSGGLHLDGFVDTSDAYFSYRNIDKRHEILADPRIGAFGAMALCLLIIGKIIVLNEIITQGVMRWEWLLFMPFLARAGMVYYFTITGSAKKSGLAFYFQERMNHQLVIVTTLLSLTIGAGIIVFVSGSVGIVMISLLTVFGCVYIYKYWTIKQFGGVTGDISGAFVEGMEVVLWLIIFISL